MIALLLLLFGLCSQADQIISRNFPHLIIPVSRLQPNTPINTQKSFDIERDVYTEFSFDVPSNGAAWCSLSFTMSVDRTRGAPWKLWGPEPYLFNISSLPPKIDKDTDTWSNRPEPLDWVATIAIFKSGTSAVYGGQWFACPKGQVAQFLAYPYDLATDGGITWFELDHPLHGITYDMWAPDE